MWVDPPALGVHTDGGPVLRAEVDPDGGRASGPVRRDPDMGFGFRQIGVAEVQGLDRFPNAGKMGCAIVLRFVASRQPRPEVLTEDS
jgi:hypothetical protein